MAGGEVAYTGPRMADAALITRDEVDAGEVQVPPGMTTHTVDRNENLWTIAKNGGYGDPPDMAAFYKDNPQYEQRNPDLIYPGEVVLVRKGGSEAANATDTAARNLAQAQQAQRDANGAGSTSQYHSEQVAKAEREFQQAAQAEIAAGGSADDIIARNGGPNADTKLTIAARRAETDQRIAELAQAKQSGQGVEQAQAALDAAVKKEIEAASYLFANDADGNGINREEHGKGAVSAGDAIQTRMQQAGLSEEAARVDGIAKQVELQINNQV